MNSTQKTLKKMAFEGLKLFSLKHKKWILAILSKRPSMMLRKCLQSWKSYALKKRVYRYVTLYY